MNATMFRLFIAKKRFYFIGEIHSIRMKKKKHLTLVTTGYFGNSLSSLLCIFPDTPKSRKISNGTGTQIRSTERDQTQNLKYLGKKLEKVPVRDRGLP
jgi:hypothetical protein